MESIFFLGEAERAAFLRHMLQSFRSTYICLWSYSPLPSNCLLFLDGFYDEERIQQPSSSTGSLATRLFNAYCGSVNYIDNGCVPGFAFKNNVTYLEMKVDYLQTMVATETQMQFYQEAGIKTAVFMGCPTGEIELGFSTHPQVNLQMEIQRWFPADFSRQTAPTNESLDPTPSSSSFDSIKYSPSIFDIPTSNFITDPSRSEAMVGEALVQDLQFPTMATHEDPRNLQRHELQIQESRTTTASQMQHMFAERRRREKINDSIQILKSLLPQLSKKDKASVLTNTTEYLSSLRSQMVELKRRNVVLEMQLSTAQRESTGEELGEAASTQRVNVEINAHVSDPSTSDHQARFLDLRMSLRSRECSLSEFIARVLRFLKEKRYVSLLSVQSNTRIVESTPIHGLLLRLKVEGDEFDESGFQEAVRRVVDGLPH